MPADMNWFAVLEHHASRAPDRAMCSYEGEVVTYTGMLARATSLAAGLHGQGIGVGDVVGLLSYNRSEFLEAMFAANYLGAILMPINWRLAAPEVTYILEHSGAKVLICDDPLVVLADDAVNGLDHPPLLVSLPPHQRAGEHPSAGYSAPGWVRLADLRAGVAPPRAWSAGISSTGSCTRRGRRVGPRG